MWSRPEKTRFEHDVPTWEDVRGFVQRFLEALALGSGGHIFCACLEFGGRYPMPLGQNKKRVK